MESDWFNLSHHHTLYTTLYTLYTTYNTLLSPLAPWDSLSCTLYMTVTQPGLMFLPLTLDKVEEVTHIVAS